MSADLFIFLEQDEEDRELALKLLGSAGSSKSKQEKRASRKEQGQVSDL
jgi:hypothetical protein